MKSDKSRETFHPDKHYSSVRLQQGRVLTDADWNEQSDIIEHRNEITARDIIGQSGAPNPPNGFMIGFNGSDITLTAGRMYVDGILCELEHPITYSGQPDLYFDPSNPTQQPPSAVLPTGVMKVAYLDVWQRHIGVIEDPLIRETALGGPDTATRAKTVWQAKVLTIDTDGQLITDIDNLPEFQALFPENQGLGALAARAQATTATTNPCIIPQSAGFRRLENQLYRVEIHTPGGLEFQSSSQTSPTVVGNPTFKWSRDNGSILAKWLDNPQGAPNTIRVELPTRDQTRGFASGEWIELTDDLRELSGVGGVFVKVAHVDGDILTIDPSTIQDPLGLVLPNTTIPRPLPPSSAIDVEARHPKVRRWDMTDQNSATGLIPVRRDIDTNDAWIDLEDGVQIRFEAGNYNVGDYWTIPARTINNAIEWPVFDDVDKTPQPVLRFGIVHHITCLASYLSSELQQQNFFDCRKTFIPLTEIAPVIQTEPSPGEFRYYLIDSAAGSDQSGHPGVGASASEAFNKAVPFATVGRATSQMSRDGHSSTAVILIKPSTKTYDDLILDGVSGYHKIVIRGSNFDDFTTDPLDNGPKVSGAIKQATLLTASPDFNASSPNLLPISLNSVLGSEPAIIGQRVRLADSQDCNMVLGVAKVSTQQSIILGTDLGSRSGGGVQVFLETPGVSFTRVVLGVVGTDSLIPAIGSEGDRLVPGLSVVGLKIDELVCQGRTSGEIAFCEVKNMLLGSFDHFQITGEFTDEMGHTRNLGVGVLASQLFSISDGGRVEIENCSALQATEVTAVHDFNIVNGFYGKTATISQCDNFSVGSLRVGSPKLVRLGVGLDQNWSPDAALVVTDSDGRVASTSFENVFSNGANQDPFAQGATGEASIKVAGVGRSLRIDDISMASSYQPSGVILDSTGAVASKILYDPTTVVVSGLVRLPNNSFFRPFELSQTDVYDSSDNHFLNPNNNFNGNNVVFTQRGLALNLDKTQGFPFNRYCVTQYVDGTNNVVVAQANQSTRLESIAGIAQQQFLQVSTSSNNNVLGKSIHLTTGYSLVLLDPSDSSLNTVTIPIPVLLSDRTAGTVCAALAQPTANRHIRIGFLVRAFNMGDNGTASGQPSRMGLVRLSIEDVTGR